MYLKCLYLRNCLFYCTVYTNYGYRNPILKKPIPIPISVFIVLYRKILNTDNLVQKSLFGSVFYIVTFISPIGNVNL